MFDVFNSFDKTRVRAQSCSLHVLSTVESRRSKRTKADDPQKDESRRSGAKADDLWVKADDPGRKQTILGLKQTIF